MCNQQLACHPVYLRSPISAAFAHSLERIVDKFANSELSIE